MSEIDKLRAEGWTVETESFDYGTKSGVAFFKDGAWVAGFRLDGLSGDDAIAAAVPMLRQHLDG